MSAAHATTVDDFIQRWSKASGSELANAQLFVSELCASLALDPPNPAAGDDVADDYVFERGVTFAHADGTVSAGRIDCYHRGAFVLESKKVRALPAHDGRPPFVRVADVGDVIEVYAKFTRSGGTSLRRRCSSGTASFR